jgi:hypothetical protein
MKMFFQLPVFIAVVIQLLPPNNLYVLIHTTYSKKQLL